LKNPDSSDQGFVLKYYGKFDNYQVVDFLLFSISLRSLENPFVENQSFFIYIDKRSSSQDSSTLLRLLGENRNVLCLNPWQELVRFKVYSIKKEAVVRLSSRYYVDFSCFTSVFW
jgi:hypothetical protein